MNYIVNKAPSDHKEQIVKFNDQTADWIYSVPSQPDATFQAAETTDATLDEFFSRPVRIGVYTWTPAVALFEYLDPWTEFFHNLRVVNRINNYNLLRCKLHVKIVLNGNGFYYGRAIAAYTPRPGEIFGSPLPRALVPQDIVQMSQLPHVYLDPTLSQGGELELPFFCPRNALSIPQDDFSQMGSITIKDMNPLYHANGGTAPVTISVFAWATDVHLSIPTSTRNGSMMPQSGDEYSDKPVSRAANTLARAAGVLSNIPTIAPYAKATQTALNSLGQAASILGYSRPTQEQPSMTVKPEYVGVLANTNTLDNATKLTMDCKQEVTVDPRVVGLGSADEMTILSLAKRESYLTSFDWSGSDAADSVLYSAYVNPISFAVAISPFQELHLTPLAFATLPFAYWRGTLKYRFQIVASAFHKGRLRIIYDPSLLQSASIGEYNINYSHVADLAGDRDFTLEFGWGQNTSWLPVISAETALLNHPYGVLNSILTTTPSSLGANGLFSVAVVNELTAASSTLPQIQINVFVSAGDDFEVCVPSCSHLANLSWAAANIGDPFPTPWEPGYHPQSGDADPTDADTESAPVQSGSQNLMAPSLPLSDHTLDVFFGDPIVSFRQCLKRYEFSRAWYIPKTTYTKYSLFKARFPDIPIYRGPVPGAIDWARDSGTGVVPFNYAKMTLLNYLLPAFAARRGGLRWKYHIFGGYQDPAYMAVTRDTDGVGLMTYTDAQPSDFGGGTAPSALACWNDVVLPHTWCATHVTAVSNNPVIEVEIPYYRYLRFYYTRDTNVTDVARFSTGYHMLSVIYPTDAQNEGTVPLIHSYVSTAEDFSLFFFSGVPPLFIQPNPVAGVAP